MRFLVLTLFICQMFSSSLTAQQAARVVCGHDLGVKLMEQQHPGYYKAVQATFDASKRRKTNTSSTRSGDVYTIPVVVHIVWNEESENLSDSLIESQIAVLNEDYRRLNEDAVNIRPIFDSLVGDPLIQFELAGIERVETDKVFESSLTGLPDIVKQTAEGGSDAWDTESYLNIWVCQLQPLTILGIPLGQILGYAYPPAGLDHWPDDVSAPSPELDGVVVDYRVFGRNNPNEIVIDGQEEALETQGRTATHEVGHYLGLRHVWGDGDPLGLSDSCDEDDGVEDTPNTGGQAAFACDLTRNTCEEMENDLPDMIENYMDYASEHCMNSFTKGQIAIMRGVLEGPRCGLIKNCVTTSTNDLNEQTALRISPNPSNGTIQIQRDLTGFTIRVYAITGQEVYAKPFTEQTFNLNKLSSGMYFFVAQKDNERLTAPFVID